MLQCSLPKIFFSPIFELTQYKAVKKEQAVKK